MIVRRTEPDDYEALHRIFSGPRAVSGTLQMPFPQAKTTPPAARRGACATSEPTACVEDEVVGSLGLKNPPTRWRTRHVATIGMAVRDDWQGRGVGTALMEAALDLADNRLNLTRVELTVYTDNAAAIALYEKFGIEGTHRRYALRDGEYVDAYSMARVRG